MKKEREVSGRTKSITQVGDGMKASVNRNYSKLGKQIKKKLIDNNMTAAQLADALGTTPQYLNKILHGDRSGEKYIEKIREILNIAA